MLRFSVHSFGGAAAMFVAVAACTPYQVHTDYDEQVSFSGKRTFAWMDSTRPADERATNPFLERRVKRAVEAAMAERGLAATEADRADVLVTAFVIGPERYDRRTTRGAFGVGTLCGPSISVWFGPRYPFGYTRRSPWYFPGSYWRSPWGYACSYRIGYGYGWLPLYDAPGGRLAGTLVIDILDGETHELLWRGSAEGALIDTRRSDQSQEEIDEIVREVLKRFPPG
ncbi:MAG TPA: DUF4136 domain-containing protein [Gemmatimonadaceae bacterium]